MKERPHEQDRILPLPFRRAEEFADRVYVLAEERGLLLSYTLRDDGPLTFEVWGEHDPRDVIAVVEQTIIEFKVDEPGRPRTTEDLLAGAPKLSTGFPALDEHMRRGSLALIAAARRREH